MNPNPSTPARVSVIMRTRNRPDLLERAVDDVFAQTFTDIDLVIVDDADDTGAVGTVVDALSAAQRTHVTVVSRAGHTHGRWHAANAGLAAARGEFVVLHDDDDLWDPQFLDTAVRTLDADPRLGGACTRTDLIIERAGDDGALHRTDRYRFLPELSGITLTDMMRANRIPPISLLYRRALHTQFGDYDEGLSVLGDWEFYLRVLPHHPFELIDGPALALWSHRPQAEGDDVNSIAADALRLATDDRIRDAYVREAARSGGMPQLMHLAHEMHWLDARIETRTAAVISELRAAGDRAQADADRVATQLAELTRELQDLRSALYERTRLIGFLSRPFRRRKR